MGMCVNPGFAATEKAMTLLEGVLVARIMLEW